MARGFLFGYVEQGGHTVLTDGRVSTDKVQQSFPLATVSIFDAGTVNLSTIFSDEGGTPKANPFIADSDGKWGFWADQARYDIQFSGAGITTPFTLFNVQPVVNVAGLVDPGSNGFLARTSLGVTAARTFLGTTSEIVVTNGTGGGNPVWSLDTNLNFAGKTISGGTFVGPSITSFSNSQHNHENAAGGGQLNATNIFSGGTVPVARLPIMVGASGVSNGVAGLVPQPVIGDESKFLRGDGTWQTAGGGGGTPGGSNTTIQYNNSGAFGGVSGATSDGTNITFGSTNLRATRPRFITSIDDTNGNELITLTSVGSAVNQVNVSNSGTGVGPTLSAVGDDADIDLNVSAKGAGIIASTSNFRISNNAPQFTLIDVNDSKTVRMSLSGANWSFINDILGSTPINIDTTSNLITIAGNFTMSKDSPAITLIDSVGGSGSDFIINRNGSTTNIGRSGQTDLSLDNTGGVYTFGQIPVGPASNPTTDNQLPRKLYVDTRKVRWSFTWGYGVLPGAVETTESVFRFIVPAGTNITVEDITSVWATGSDSGASNIFTIKRRNAAGTLQGDVGTIDVNSGAQNVLNINNIGDVVLTTGDQLYPLFTTRNTASEQLVSITIRGFQEMSS